MHWNGASEVATGGHVVPGFIWQSKVGRRGIDRKLAGRGVLTPNASPNTTHWVVNMIDSDHATRRDAAMALYEQTYGVVTQSVPTGSTPCPFCGHERNLRIVGCVVCAYHTLTVSNKDDLGALLIDDLAVLAQTPVQRRRNKRMEVA